MKNKINKLFEFTCDRCETTVIHTDTRDFQEAMDRLKEEGWRSVRGRFDWEHYCSKC